MSKKNDCWGIEVGANAIKAMRLVRSGDKIEVAGYDVLRFSKVLTTPDLDVDEAIQVNLDRFLSRHSVKGKSIMVSVPGHMAFARFAKLPPVEPKRIPDIVKFEAVQQIPFPIDQVEWDFQVFSQEDSPDVEVGIFAITKERIRNYLQNFKAVGMDVDGVTLSSLALYNAMAHDMELKLDSPGTIFMDIGTISTDMIIVEEGSIWLRPIPIGGNNFTEALLKAFKLSFPKAEKLKREAATSKYARQIFQAMRPVFTDLVQEIQKSMGYYQSMKRGADIKRLVGFGSTFRLPGLQKFLKQQLQMDVIRLDSFKHVSVDGKKEADFSERTLNLGTAYGLALQGLGMEKVGANILPKQIINQKIWRAKQPWMAAAAAVTLGATGLAGFQLAMAQNDFSNAMGRSEQRLRTVKSKAQNLVAEWDSVVTAVDQRQRIENLRRILDYRDVWPKILQDLSQVQLSMNPQPSLLNSDYGAVSLIPRPERRRIYIEKVNAQYTFVWDEKTSNTSTSRDSARAGLTIEQIWGTQRRNFNEEETPKEEGEAAPPPQPTAPGATTPPSFKLTIEGYTSFKDPDKIIAAYLNWLEENQDRLDRPYKYVVVRESALPDFRPVVEGGAAARSPGRSPVMVPGMRQPTNNAPTSFYPERPLSDEPRNTDYRFTLTYTVQLVRPEDTRQTEKVTQPAADSGSVQRPVVEDRS